MFMFNGNATPSLADIAAVTGNNRSNDGGFGDGNGWWVLIILFAIFGGLGNNGYGNNRGNNASDGVSSVVYMPPMGGYGMSVGSSYTDSASQRGFDNQAVTNKLNGLENGICSLGYDQLAQMNTINSNIMQTGYTTQNAVQQSGYNAQNAIQQATYNLQNAIQANSIANMQQSNTIQTQLASCCCENREAIAGVNYNLATDTCAITTAVNQAAQNIVENANSNYRTLHEELVQSQLEAKNEKIAELQAALTAAQNREVNNSQSAYLINTLRPIPGPMYPVQNPWSGSNVYMTGCCANS